MKKYVVTMEVVISWKECWLENMTHWLDIDHHLNGTGNYMLFQKHCNPSQHFNIFQILGAPFSIFLQAANL